MRKIKYIRLKNNGAGLVIFPCSMIHSEVANGQEVASAGFIDPQTWECFGESMSLGLPSQKIDTAILRRMVGTLKEARQ